MNPLVMGLITGGANLLGSIFSSEQSGENTRNQIVAQQGMQAESEQFNAGQAQISRDYNTQMSNTAYQRASADMKAAGLNPMMMTGGAMNASTPASPTASIGTPSVPMPSKTSPMASLGSAVASGLDAAISAKTIDVLTSKIANMEAEREKMGEETANVEQSRHLQALQFPGARVASKEAEGVEGLGDKIVRGAGVVKYGAKALENVGDAVWSLVPSAPKVLGMMGNRTGRVTEPVKRYEGLGPSGRQAVKDAVQEEVEQQMSHTAKSRVRGGFGAFDDITQQR